MTGADFVQDAGVGAAEDIVKETTVVRMSPQEFGAFMAAIEAPATVVPELIELFKRKAPWATGDD